MTGNATGGSPAIAGIGRQAVRPVPQEQTGIGGRVRSNSGAWTPFVDWEEIFPGNRGMDRQGRYNLYDAPAGIRLAIQQGQTTAPLLIAEAPWENGGGLQPYGLWQADGAYHLLYGAYAGDRGSRMCYATSEDAVHWTRPILGQVEFDGSRQNNILAGLPAGGPGFFIDSSAPPDAKFKYMRQEGGGFDPETGERLSDEEWQRRLQARDRGGPDHAGPKMVFRHWLTGYVSPDGVHWRALDKPIGTFAADGGIAPGYDPATGQYFAFVRPSGTGRRAIGLAKAEAFDRWTASRLVLFPDPQDDPDVSFYGVNYFRYPGRDDLHGMFVQVYHQVTDHIDDQVAFSRDGLFWNRPERRPIIAVGPAGSGYDCMVRTWGGELAVLPGGDWATLHEGVSWLHNYRPIDGNDQSRGPLPGRRAGEIRWARWQPHRLAGVEAHSEGTFTVHALARNARSLRMNYRCSPGGWVSVELLKAIPSRLNPDALGVPGYTFEACDRLYGDELACEVTWNGQSDLSAIGDSLAMRVRLFQATVFAYRC